MKIGGDADVAGKVNIGVANGSKQLTVKETIRISRSGNGNQAGDKAELSFGYVGGDAYGGSIRLENTASNPGTLNPKLVFRLQKWGTWLPEDQEDRMVINEYGNIGIGVDDPTEKLEVDGSVKISDVLKMTPLSGSPAGTPDEGDVYMDNGGGTGGLGPKIEIL